MTRAGPIWTGSTSKRPACRSPNPFPGFPPRTADGTVPVPRHLPRAGPARPEAGEATPPLPEEREAMAAIPARRRSPGHRAAGEATPPRMAAREAVAAMAASVSPRHRPAVRRVRPSADLVFPLFGSRPRDSTWNPRRGPFPFCPGHAVIAYFFGGVGSHGCTGKDQGPGRVVQSTVGHERAVRPGQGAVDRHGHGRRPAGRGRCHGIERPADDRRRSGHRVWRDARAWAEPVVVDVDLDAMAG